MAGEPKQEAQPTEVPLRAEVSEVSQLERELADARKRSEELHARLQYLQADLENYRKRADREREQVVRYANEAFAGRLLPVLDDFDAAVSAVPGKARKGLEMLRSNLVKALGEFGLEEIPADGAPFDPYLHECLQQASDPEVPDGTVTEVVQKGYRFQGKVLRPAQVIVSSHQGPQPQEPGRPKEGEQDA